MNSTEQSIQSATDSSESVETPKPTGSKMGAEPQTLPDDPVSPSSHGIPQAARPLRKGLSASEIIEAQQSGSTSDESKGDNHQTGDVPTIMDQKRSSPDMSRDG